MSHFPAGRIPRTPATIVRPIIDTDIDHILGVQRLAYEPHYWESADSFRSKVAASTGSSFGAWFEGEMTGYLIALPLPGDVVPDLNSAATPETPLRPAEVMFIHDLAVRPDRQAMGMADVLLVHLYETALRHQIEHFRLVSVQGSQPFWSNRGFGVDVGPVPPGYGPEAVLMSRR